MLRLTVILFSFLLTSCSPIAEPTGFWRKLWKIEVGPDYKRPDVAPAQEFRSEIGPAENASLADLPWWGVFRDPRLQQLIAEALAHNYDLRLAVARVEQARSEVWIAASPFYPQAGYQVFAGREKVFTPLEKANGNITFNAFGWLLNATWELDLWGRIRRSTEVARANLLAQEDIRRGVMLTLVSDVATGYFRLVELDRELAIAQESSRTYRQTLDLFSQRFEFGRDSKLPVERAQAAYDSSIANIAALRRASIQQENAISILVGAYPRETARGVVLIDQAMPNAPVGLTTDLLQRRPDVMQAEQTMIGANAEIGIAVANFFPRISIWNIAGGFAGPLFQGGRLIESYHAQEAFWNATIAQYKQTVLIAFQEVSDALIAQQTLVEQRAALTHQVAALREAVNLSLLRYTAGRASYFEVLEAEQLLFPTEDALAQSQRDQLLAVVNLYKALGGGWSLSDVEWNHPH